MSTPRISVGVPVYNGGALLADALTCLARQDFPDFEIIVSDNASTDGSGDLAESFADRDPRFRVIRQAHNIGPLPNFLTVAEAARAPHFLWRAHDDLSSLDYLSRLHAVLDRYPQANIAVPRAVTIRIGKAKRRIRRVPGAVVDGPGADPAHTLARSAAGWFYGMMRHDYALASIRAVIDNYKHLWAWDHLMLFPAIAAGQVVGDDQALFFHRLNRQGEKAALPRSKEELRDIRAQYAEFCAATLAGIDLTGPQRLRLRLALVRHVDRRVVSLSRTL